MKKDGRMNGNKWKMKWKRMGEWMEINGKWNEKNGRMNGIWMENELGYKCRINVLSFLNFNEV